MKLVLFGPPGAGKGTQAEEITKVYNVPHISTGALLRKNIEEKTQIGLVALRYIERGKLAPDEVVIDLIKSEVDLSKGFLLDGFPRTLDQAVMLDKITSVDKVIDLKLGDKVIVDRIINRLVCPQCGKNYSRKETEVCLCDGAKLVSRSDDTEEIVRERLNVYHTQTEPIIDYYRSQGKLVEIDGNGTVQEVFERIKKAL